MKIRSVTAAIPIVILLITCSQSAGTAGGSVSPDFHQFSRNAQGPLLCKTAHSSDDPGHEYGRCENFDNCFQDVEARPSNGNATPVYSRSLPGIDQTSVALDVHEFARDARGFLAWNATASFTGAGIGSGPGYCANQEEDYWLVFEGKHPDGNSETIQSVKVHSDQPLPYQSDFTGGSKQDTFAEVRTLAISRAGTIASSGWVPLSENVKEGHDLDASLALVVTALASSTKPCIALFPVGTHTIGTSTSDEQNSCIRAMDDGQTLEQFEKGYFAHASSQKITQALINAGLYARAELKKSDPNLDYGKTLPAGCLWTGLVVITCTWNSGTKVFRPYSAPPRQDPLWENNGKSVNPVPPTSTSTSTVPEPARSAIPLPCRTIKRLPIGAGSSSSNSLCSPFL